MVNNLLASDQDCGFSFVLLDLSAAFNITAHAILYKIVYISVVSSLNIWKPCQHYIVLRLFLIFFKGCGQKPSIRGQLNVRHSDQISSLLDLLLSGPLVDELQLIRAEHKLTKRDGALPLTSAQRAKNSEQGCGTNLYSYFSFSHFS